MARPKLNIDVEEVRKLAEIGCNTVEMGHFFSCDPQTITNRFSDILKKSSAKLKMSLRRVQINAALKGNITMMIWLGKQLLDQCERQQVVLSKIPDDVFLEEAKRRLTITDSGSEVKSE